MRQYPKVVAICLSPFIVGWMAVFFGAYGITPGMVLKVILNDLFHLFYLGDIPEKAIILDIRLPRVILAGIVGAALSGSGVVLQAIFRNPLVDPFILGISAGAAFGCAITVGFLSFLPVQSMAFLFAVAAVFLAYITARTQGEVSRLPLILSGVIVSAFFTALVSIVKFLVDPHKLQSIVYWELFPRRLEARQAFLLGCNSRPYADLFHAVEAQCYQHGRGGSQSPGSEYKKRSYPVHSLLNSCRSNGCFRLRHHRLGRAYGSSPGAYARGT